MASLRENVKLAKKVQEVGGLGAGVKGSKTGVVIESRGIRQTSFAFAAAGADLMDLTSNQLLKMGKDMNRLAKDNFVDSLNPEWPSATIGGDRYGVGGRRGRQTGQFTFGSGGAFSFHFPTLNKDTGEIVLGFPKVTVADEQTKGIWRRLEFGLPDSLHEMPEFYFRGKTPYPRTGLTEDGGPGFKGKHFLEEAFDQVVKDAEGKFQKLGREVANKM
jgi:hypothetical protein